MSRSKELIFLNINVKELIFRIKTTMTIYIISQILAFIAFLLSLLAYYRSKKEKIMLTMVASNTLNLIHYLLL
ncbi:YgjV family protein [bacterium]|nr:YgjV family protein [bacterium]